MWGLAGLLVLLVLSIALPAWVARLVWPIRQRRRGDSIGRSWGLPTHSRNRWEGVNSRGGAYRKFPDPTRPEPKSPDRSGEIPPPRRLDGQSVGGPFRALGARW